MKKVLALVLIALVSFSSVGFAQYGWGGWGGWSSNGWGGSISFALNRDVCPNGDKTPSIFDGSCGDSITDQLLVTWPTKKIKKKRRISFTKFLLRLQSIGNIFKSN